MRAAETPGALRSAGGSTTPGSSLGVWLRSAFPTGVVAAPNDARRRPRAPPHAGRRTTRRSSSSFPRAGASKVPRATQIVRLTQNRTDRLDREAFASLGVDEPHDQRLRESNSAATKIEAAQGTAFASVRRLLSAIRRRTSSVSAELTLSTFAITFDGHINPSMNSDARWLPDQRSDLPGTREVAPSGCTDRCAWRHVEVGAAILVRLCRLRGHRADLVVDEVLLHGGTNREYALRGGAVAQGGRRGRSGRDGLTCAERRGVRARAEPHEVHELLHGQRIRVFVPVRVAEHGVACVTVRAVLGPPVPYPHDCASAVTEVLEPARRADDGVVAPVVGREVALLIAGEHAGLEPHEDHRLVFDVDDGVEARLLQGRPVVHREPARHGLAGPVSAITDAAVQAQVAHGHDVAGVGARKPVDDVKIVRALLE